MKNALKSPRESAVRGSIYDDIIDDNTPNRGERPLFELKKVQYNRKKDQIAPISPIQIRIQTQRL